MAKLRTHLVAAFLPLPGIDHVGIGVSDLAPIDDFDAGTPFWSDVVAPKLCDLDPTDLTPTQELVEITRLQSLINTPAERLPPVKVVSVGGQARILDGHHRACVAAYLRRKVRALVLTLAPKRSDSHPS